MDAEYIEVWKDITEYEGLYQVSNMGRVKSIGYGEERILKPGKNHNGYFRVGLSKEGKVKWFFVHRLVAEAFLPNTDNLPQVNHKNEIKDDNRACNLEWCSAKYNINYGTCIKRRTEKQKVDFINRLDISKPVLQYTKDGLLIASYPSTREVSRQTGYANSNISKCCNGKCKFAYGFIWKYQ